MIRNYYTESFKDAIVPPVSTTQLIDGTVKVISTFTANDNVVIAAPTNKITFAASHTQIKIGMFVSGTDGNGVVIPSGTRVIGVNSDSKIITISSTIAAFLVNQNITFTVQNQSSWKEYNLYVGKYPASYLPDSGGIVTTAMSNAAAAGQAILTWKQPNSLIVAGMLVYDDGVLVGTKKILGQFYAFFGYLVNPNLIENVLYLLFRYFRNISSTVNSFTAGLTLFLIFMHCLYNNEPSPP